MLSHEPTAESVAFGCFEVNLATGEVFRNGRRLRLSGQPSQVLVILVQRAGQLVTREELRLQLWPDETFVDFDHGLNNCINRIRDVLGDSAGNPRFIETLPKQGYRFVAPIKESDSTIRARNGSQSIDGQRRTIENPPQLGPRLVPPAAVRRNGNVPAVSALRAALTPRYISSRSWALIAAVASVLLASVGWLAYKSWRGNGGPPPIQRALTRLTSDEGLQTGATWSPDGRFIAYTSDRGGKYDIWVQQISGGDPIQITRGPAQNWQPEWSPDGKYIAYRSEEGEGGIYITPALGGAGQQRKIASFGYYPRWSTDSSRLLLQLGLWGQTKVYLVGLDENPPREVLTGLGEDHTRISTWAWHPDGKRITTWVSDSYPIAVSGSPIPSFSTEPVDGGPAIESKFSPEFQKQLEAVAAAPGVAEWRTDFRFAWAPSGKAIYFERSFRGARNIWRMTVDPVTLQPSKIERLTTSPGLDAELSISPDGRKMAFTSERQQVRAWEFPFDANRGQVTGPGQPVTPVGIEAWQVNLSRDGKKLGVWGNHDGQLGIWETSLPNGREEPLMAGDSYMREHPIWSPDGKHMAYVRWRTDSDKDQVVIWSSDHRNEDPVEAESSTFLWVFDWSPDGNSVLMARRMSGTARSSIWQLFVYPSVSGESSARKVTADSNYDLYQAHFSPDGKWIVFEAVKDLSHSTIYAIPAVGGSTAGSWIRITDGKQWDDKPRWSPDGKTIYYLSKRRGFFNVWGVHFDPVRGRPQGEPFQVTSLETPTLMIPQDIPYVEFSFSADRLVLPLTQSSGNIWILDNVDR